MRVTPAPVNSHARVCNLYGSGAPLRLRAGGVLSPVRVTYETWGKLDAARSNAVFVCHALTGDAHVARHHDGDEPGWWDVMVGPGRPIDTDRYYVICANSLGGCAGTTGPWSPGSDDRPLGAGFPEVHVEDMVRVHRRLLAELGIGRLRCVIGGSLGGMQTLQWFLQSPQEADAFFAIAASARLSAENLAWNAVSRAAIRADPLFADGCYGNNDGPAAGLGIARMIGHLMYLSEESLETKFGRAARRDPAAGAHPAVVGPFAVEQYLDHQARKLIDRFDANTYLYLTRAMDSFDPFTDVESLDDAHAETRVELFSFVSDRLFGVSHSNFIRAELKRRSTVAVSHYHETSRTVGHDAFLLYIPDFLDAVRERLAPAPRQVVTSR
jgi:homoserine O-acetyltransferase